MHRSNSRQLEKNPRKGTRKAEIIDSLVKRGISYPEKVTVKQLLEIVSKNQNLFKKLYAVDTIAQKAGHEVCRLPPYYCIFNPIELMWSYVKKTIRRENITPTVGDSVITKIRHIINTSDPILWKNSYNHCKKIEQGFLKTSCTNFIINVGSDSSDNETMENNSESEEISESS